jgi:hypothetical protein
MAHQNFRLRTWIIKHPGLELWPIVIDPEHAPSGEDARPYLLLFLACLPALDMGNPAVARRVLEAIRDTGAVVLAWPGSRASAARVRAAGSQPGSVSGPRCLITALRLHDDRDKRFPGVRIGDHHHRVRVVLDRSDRIQAGRGEPHVQPGTKRNASDSAQQVDGQRRVPLDQLQRCLVSNGELRNHTMICA